MSESTYRFAVVGLLIGLLILQLGIWERLRRPLTTADVLAAPAEQRRDLVKQIPLVRISGTVDVEVENTVQVEVENIVPVEIQR